MSETHQHKMTLVEFFKKGDSEEEFESVCKSICDREGLDLGLYYDTYEAMICGHSENYMIIDGTIYEITNHILSDILEHYSATKVEDGVYNVDVIFYDGNQSLDDVIETAMESINET